MAVNRSAVHRAMVWNSLHLSRVSMAIRSQDSGVYNYLFHMHSLPMPDAHFVHLCHFPKQTVSHYILLSSNKVWAVARAPHQQSISTHLLFVHYQTLCSLCLSLSSLHLVLPLPSSSSSSLHSWPSVCLCVLQVFSLTILSALVLNQMASQDTIEELIAPHSGQNETDPILAEILTKETVLLWEKKNMCIPYFPQSISCTPQCVSHSIFFLI